MISRDLVTGDPNVLSYEEMETFKKVLNIRNEEFQAIEIMDKKLVEGQKVRVPDGPLEGVVGVVNRIKGDRMLLVSVSDVVAIATGFVKTDYLKKN